MPKPRISLLITDLDNTIYDWMAAFVPSLYAMVRVASEILDVRDEVVLDELREVHQKHRDTEHPFALLQTRSVDEFARNNPRIDVARALDPAFHAFNRLRKENLKLYETVSDTLNTLREAKIPVVGYTDARVVNSLFRIKRLNIRDRLVALYAPEQQTNPISLTHEDQNFVRLLDINDRKPNEQTLKDICTDFRISPQETLYVGDSIVRDMYMADKAGVNTAWARYGTIYDKSLWSRLVRVTHWTQADVEREASLKSQIQGLTPNCVLERFSDIFSYYEFCCSPPVSEMGAKLGTSF
jgi:FMN phosphatase YigB (HAD superfamily)